MTKKLRKKRKNHNRNFAIESGLLSLYKLTELRNYQAHVGYVGCVVLLFLLLCSVQFVNVLFGRWGISYSYTIHLPGVTQDCPRPKGCS